MFYNIRASHKRHTCAMHSQCVNTGQRIVAQQIERTVIVKALFT
jgi:hypothetical protein